MTISPEWRIFYWPWVCDVIFKRIDMGPDLIGNNNYLKNRSKPLFNLDCQVTTALTSSSRSSVASRSDQSNWESSLSANNISSKTLDLIERGSPAFNTIRSTRDIWIFIPFLFVIVICISSSFRSFGIFLVFFGCF